MKLSLISYSIKKIEFKMNKDLKIRPEIVKLLEENRGKLLTLIWTLILGYDIKNTDNKSKKYSVTISN